MGTGNDGDRAAILVGWLGKASLKSGLWTEGRKSENIWRKSAPSSGGTESA